MAERMWMEELRAATAAAQKADEALSRVQSWVWDHVVPDDVYPREMPEALREQLKVLRDALDAIRAQVEEAQDRYGRVPDGKFLSGMPLTTEEYHVVAAEGGSYGTAKKLGLSAYDDYDLFRMLCYEDDTRYAYVNPTLPPPEPFELGKLMACGGFGCAPEGLRFDALRPEQKEFFKRYMPSVYARFKRD